VGAGISAHQKVALASQQLLEVLAAPPKAGLAALDDPGLANALLASDPRAPREAWERFSPMVRRVLSRMLGPEHEVEDAVQDVFVHLFERVHTLRTPAALRAFVISIALLTARYEIRRRRVRRWVGLYPTGELPDIRVVEADSESREALIRFYRILERVRARDRAAFVLRYVEGMEVAEVAAALDVSVPTARRCFTRAWRRVVFFAERDAFLADYLPRRAPARGPERGGCGA
jgi:RNA polymerase sigma-70 factor, ECF subfamily